MIHPLLTCTTFLQKSAKLRPAFDLYTLSTPLTATTASLLYIYLKIKNTSFNPAKQNEPSL